MRKNKSKSVSSWSVDDLFSLHVDTICRLNTDVNRTVEVSIDLFVSIKKLEYVSRFFLIPDSFPFTKGNTFVYDRWGCRLACSTAESHCARPKRLQSEWCARARPILTWSLSLTSKCATSLVWLGCVSPYMKYRKPPRVLKPGN